MARHINGPSALTSTEIVDRLISGDTVPPQAFARFLKGLGKYLASELGVTNGAFRQGVIDNM